MIKYALKNINLYESKSNESKILTAIPMGSKINVLDMEEEWDKASFNSITGYVESIGYQRLNMHGQMLT